ncbi:hypothetical protein Micbo1qcDRAFT_169466 [Microdochium bolleyi]|uniref:Uncharacterized protein n=1 Tax=Microdochium bolleyi TaxID=196109 RepID=A0A136IKA0_9PEZI|nr:hypothetical protein Micbo1qcDRAFT_169466 [Microdochium bolleyi]
MQRSQVEPGNALGEWSKKYTLLVSSRLLQLYLRRHLTGQPATARATVAGGYWRRLDNFNRLQTRELLSEHFTGVSIPKDIPYVHPRCISFRNLKERNDAIRPPGTRDTRWPIDLAVRDTFKEFWQAPKGCTRTWLAFFAYPPSDSHDPEAKEDKVFIVLILNSTSTASKQLVIYDCNSSADAESATVDASRVLTGLQLEFFKFVQSKCVVEAVWYSVKHSRRGTEGDVEASFHRLASWFNAGDKALHGAEDNRVAQCLSLTCS